MKLGIDPAIKVYIAAPWACKVQALAAQEAFEAAGIEVTSHWIKYHPDVTPDEEGYEAMLVQQAQGDVADIIRADVLVVYNLAKSEGKAWEFGFSYALSIPTVLVGSKGTNIFYNLPFVNQVASTEEAIEKVKELYSADQAEV